MRLSVNSEIERFSQWIDLFKGSSYQVNSSIPLSLQITKENDRKARPHLTFLALVHGNETCGIGVLNEIIRLLQSGLVKTDLNLCFMIGNEPAARENKRFLKENMNRCFGLTSPRGRESERAIEMCTLMAKTDFLVDLHQTNGVTDRSFFIFPFTPKGYRFARAIDPFKTIVTHWGSSFSTEGMCSDEFVNSKGGCGLTIELGQAGFNGYQLSDGVLSCLKAIYTVEAILKGDMQSDLADVDLETAGDTYTFAHVQELPKAAEVILKPGWQNFSPLSKGDLIGTINGKEYFAGQDGCIMFPYYPNPKVAVGTPNEAWRILKSLKVSDLPW